MPDFEPRRADPGQEFTYTTTDRRELADGDEPPEGATIALEHDAAGADGVVPAPRRFAIREGVQRTIRADDQGVVHPQNAEDVRALDLYDLPVARKVLAAEKAAEKKEG